MKYILIAAVLATVAMGIQMKTEIQSGALAQAKAGPRGRKPQMGHPNKEGKVVGPKEHKIGNKGIFTVGACNEPEVPACEEVAEGEVICTAGEVVPTSGDADAECTEFEGAPVIAIETCPV